MPRNYYAAQSPRGFANEIKVYAFLSRKARDQWVKDHEYDGGCNAASLGAYAITAKHAYSILGDKGDAATQTFNSLIRIEGSET